MNLLQSVLIHVVVLLFPLIVYLFYVTYSQYANPEKRDLFLDFALLSSLYLLISSQNIWQYNGFMVLLDIPLIIAYFKKRGFVGIMLSIFIIFAYYQIDSHFLWLLSIQYIILYFLYRYWNMTKKNYLSFINICLMIKAFGVYVYQFLYQNITVQDLTNTTLVILIFVMITHLTVYIFKKGEDIMNLHISMKQIEQETQYRTSLFKITHEIKNPIAVCKSYLDMFDFNNPDHQRYIPIIKEEIQKILFLLQDFLSMNKIKIEKETLDTTMLLEEIIEQYEPILTASGVEFHYEILDDEVYIEGDYNRLMQVMINIIKNAQEAKTEMPMSITLKSERKKNHICITITDTGSGFDMDEFEKIKEPFYTTKKNGTGLGVSLSYEIISAHNGTISYESKVGKGTKVMITLPIVDLD